MLNLNKPSYEIIETPAGVPTLKVQGEFLHSRYQPQKEVEKIVNRIDSQKIKMVIVLEGGLGYLPLEIAKQFPQIQLFIVVPQSHLFDFLCKEGFDFRQKLPSKTLLLSPYSESSFAATIAPETAETILFLTSPAIEKLYPKTTTSIKSMLQQHLQIQSTNEATLKKYGPRIHSNIQRNLLQLKTIPYKSLLDYQNSASGKTIVVVGAGPTLDSHIEELKKYRSQFILMAVDTAATPLARQGLIADYVVTGDPQFYNSQHLTFFDGSKSHLIAPLSTYPTQLHRPWRQRIIYASRFPEEESFAQSLKLPLLGSGGTVASTAIEVCRILNPKEIRLVGVDLGYPEGKSHAKAAFFEERSLFNALRLNPFETQSYQILHSPLTTLTTNGVNEPLLSDRRMDIYRQWFEKFAQDCIRIDPRGALIKNLTTIKDLF